MAVDIFELLITIFSLGSLVVGIIACYKILGNYLKLRSVEFLLVLSFFWGQTYWMGVRVRQYVVAFGYNFGLNMDVTLFEKIFSQGFWGIGFVGLMFHLYRIMDWETHSRLLKHFYQFMLLEGILEAFFYVENPIYMLSMGGANYETTKWYQQGWFFLYGTRLVFAIFPDLLPSLASDETGFFGIIGINLWLLIFFMLVAYTYLKVQPIQSTPEIRLSRYCWVLFGLFNALRWTINISDIFHYYIYNYASTTYGNYPVVLLFTVFEFLSLGSILFLVAFYPNTLLITKAQLMQASELYKYLNLEKQEQEKLSQFGLVNETNLLIEYVNNLPEDIKSQLSEKSH